MQELVDRWKAGTTVAVGTIFLLTRGNPSLYDSIKNVSHKKKGRFEFIMLGPYLKKKMLWRSKIFPVQRGSSDVNFPSGF